MLFATGAQTDRRMGIPGEDLRNSHPATSFVAWYNGHPDYREPAFDLVAGARGDRGRGQRRDRRGAHPLPFATRSSRATDMAEYAIEALSASRVREVYLLGRRGPAQAAFTNPEIKELGELAGRRRHQSAAESASWTRSAAKLVAKSSDRALDRKVEMLQAYASARPADKPRELDAALPGLAGGAPR